MWLISDFVLVILQAHPWCQEDPSYQSYILHVRWRWSPDHCGGLLEVIHCRRMTRSTLYGKRCNWKIGSCICSVRYSEIDILQYRSLLVDTYPCMANRYQVDPCTHNQLELKLSQKMKQKSKNVKSNQLTFGTFVFNVIHSAFGNSKIAWSWSSGFFCKSACLRIFIVSCWSALVDGTC